MSTRKLPNDTKLRLIWHTAIFYLGFDVGIDRRGWRGSNSR